ncbi:MAG: hypothetical protein KBH11_00400 [Bacteroidia bacterium]|nr:hypothetical protein [Bacteroidota bacterium]MBP9081505.1 hypothetical protein [Bacteroidia bacterium]
MRKYYLVVFILFTHVNCFTQGFNYQWIIGDAITIIDTNTTAKAARIISKNPSANVVINYFQLLISLTNSAFSLFNVLDSRPPNLFTKYSYL